MGKLPGMSGFFVATISPFTKDNQFNPDALSVVMERTITQGATGFLVAGSSGEFPLLSFEERVASFEAAAAFRDRAHLMANISAVGVDEAIRYAERAAKCGCQSILSTAPIFYKFSQQAMADYFRAIHEAIDLPLFLYNFPVNTGVELDVDHHAIRAILTDGTLAGVKQTSINAAQMERMIHMNQNLVVFGGYDEMYLANRAMGAIGAIGASFNFTLPLFTPIAEAFARNDMAAALAMQKRASDVVFLLSRCGTFPSIKYSVNRLGIEVGECRRPFAKLTAESRALLDQMLEEHF